MGAIAEEDKMKSEWRVSIPAMGGNRRNKEDANRRWIINPRNGGQ